MGDGTIRRIYDMLTDRIQSVLKQGGGDAN